MGRTEVALRVNGREFTGWKSARVTRSIEAAAGGFHLEVSERWSLESGRARALRSAAEQWQILEEDECQVLVAGELLLTGYVDRREPSHDATQHSLSIEGKDRAGALVECSAIPRDWELSGTPLLRLVRMVAEPFAVAVTVQPGLEALGTTAIPKLSVDPGDSAWETIEKALRQVGCLACSDGKGGVVLTRAGTGRATTALVLGENIKSGTAGYDATGRYYRYRVTAQKSGDDDDFGLGAASVRGEAVDSGVRRRERVLMIRAEGLSTNAQAKRRAEWEAKVRAARGDAVRVTVQGWQQADGKLWPLNALVQAKDPWLGVDGQMLITSTTFSLDESGGSITELGLMRPDAFLPEPVVPPTGAWKEIAGGGR